LYSQATGVFCLSSAACGAIGSRHPAIARAVASVISTGKWYRFIRGEHAPGNALWHALGRVGVCLMATQGADLGHSLSFAGMDQALNSTEQWH
jgi:hypothetical protein